MANSYVQPIQLPTECGSDLDSIGVVAIGIGLSGFASDYDILLRQAHIKTMSFADCSQFIGADEKPDSMLCAEPNLNQAVFSGDSGMNN